MIGMFVNGERVLSASGDADAIVNPATGEIVEQMTRGTRHDAQQAIEAAAAAFPGWAEVPFSRRGEILSAAAQLILQHEKALAETITLEQGKPLAESMREIRRFVHTITHYAGLAKNVRGGYTPLLGKNTHGKIIKKPIGVCGAIVPWNFPVALMGNKIAPGLLAGNTFVVKPAGTTPLAATRCIELFHEAGLPKGVLNAITGPGSTVGQELIENPLVRKIGFTGSTETGKRVMAGAAKEIKKVTLELGGSDPMIVCDDADLDRAVSAASVGRFYNCGQACLAIKRLYVFQSIAEEFTKKLLAKVQRLRVGNGMAEGTIIGPMHTAAQRTEIEEQVQDAIDRGARVLIGGRRPEGAAFAKGNYYLPTLLTKVDADSKVLREEVFGPVLPIVPVGDFEEAIEKANDSEFGLGSSVWTRDLRRAELAAERLDTGYTWINSAQIIFDELPFGGTKHSGLGKEHGSEALDYYMETKSVVVNIE